MQLNELLEQYSIKEISSKTRIAPENLEYLHGRDWDMMRKVQALGFINILEREYGVDLSDLRKECIEYYSEHSQGLGGENIELHMEDSHRGSLVNILTKIAIFIFIVALATGSWYIFVGDSDSKNSDEFVNKKSGFYDSVMSMANKLMDDGNESVSNELALTESESSIESKSREREKSATSNTTITDEKSKEKIKLEYAKKPEESDTNDKDKAKEQKPKEKSSDDGSKPLKITDVIPTITTDSTENSEKAQDNIQESKSDEETQNSESVAKQEDSQSGEDNMDNNSDENSIVDDTSSVVSLLPEVPSLTTDKKSQAKSETEVQSKKSGEQKAADGAYTVILEPGSKVWIGFRELRSGKRTAEVITEPVKFDTKGSDYILATGHGILVFKNGEGKELLKMRDGKKHFFMIAKGGVREISHEKFQQLNGSKVW